MANSALRAAGALLLGLLVCPTARALAQDGTPRLAVFPERVQLHGARAAQGLVVQAVAPDGSTREVTADAQFAFTQPGLARIERGIVKPQADGKTELTVAYQGHTARVAVEVKGAAAEPPVSFKLDVMPVFTKAGCNAGKCHGSARGQNGFRLSLFGYDPDGDYFRLLREMPGRRVNLARPDDCLLVGKSLANVSHAGGQRFDTDSPLYQTLRRWLEAGAPADAPGTPTPVGLEVLPRELVLDGKGTTHRITVRARYSDGGVRDVTGLALFLSNNEGVAAVSEQGLVTAGERGATFVMARFATFTEGAQVIVRPKGSRFIFPADVKEHNYLDALVHARLKKLHVAPSEVCGDEVFLRRLYLDMIGLLPTPAERQRFLSDRTPDKRDRLVEELLARKEFNDYWVMRWAELLQIRRSNGISVKALQVYHDWLSDRVRRNVPPNQMVQEILSATGGTFTSPAANYYQTETEPITLAENAAQAFLGIRIQCAQCHNHPFDRWTMNDYYGFTAFFGRVGYRTAQDPREIVIFDRGEGETRHPVDNRVVAPKFLGGAVADTAGKDYRAVLGRWLGDKDNPFFARHLANVVWAQYLGKGIVDPVDDVRVSNPPANPELLDELTRRLVAYEFDIKKLVRDICTSRTYQLTTRRNDSNKHDDRYFASAQIRRLRAEVLLDCIAQVTEQPSKFTGTPAGTRAVHLLDDRVKDYFLTTFGRSPRTTACSCEVKVEPTLSQALHLLNGDSVSGRIVSGKVIPSLLAAQRTPSDAIEELYQRCLCRRPTPAELSRLLAAVRPSPQQRQDLEDVFWALLNSKEFLFNH
jgi:hypothetical protein